MNDKRQHNPVDFNDAAEVLNLIERYVAGQITESECERLDSYLEANPECRQYFRRQLDTHLLLQEMLTSQSSENSSAGILQWCALRAFAAAEEDLAKHVKSPSTVSNPLQPRKGRQPFFVKWIVVPVILFIIAFGIYSEFFSRRPTAMPKRETFARIEETIDVEWGEGNPVFKPGAGIDNEIIRFQKGIVKITIQNGAELILEGPSEFIVSGKLRTLCQKGKVNARIPKSARYFELTTPFFRIVDLGTEFSVAVDEQSSDVHVLSGKVELSRDKNERLPLSQGESRRSARGGIFETIPFDEAACIGLSLFETLWQKQAAQQAEQRSRLADRLAGEPDLLTLFDGTRFYGHGSGTVEGCRDADDQNRKAVRIRSNTSRVDLDVPGSFESLTMILAVRIHRLEHVSRLLISDDYYGRTGVMLWQLERNGAMQFHVRTEGDRNAYDAFDLDGAFQTKDLGTWTMLAVSIDGPGRTVTHYKDGKEIARFPWEKPIPIEIGRSCVGNEKGETKKRMPRFLDADLGTLAILRRALSPEEIADIYDMMK